MKVFIGNKNQYKANLHCHSNLSDGYLTPEELKDLYKGHGYSILAITDHEYLVDHSDLNDEDFLTITAYEAFARDKTAIKPIRAEAHLNLYSKDPHNTTMVCYNENETYVPKELRPFVKYYGERTDDIQGHTVEYVNHIISEAKKHNFFVSYNHPQWSLETILDAEQYKGFDSLEIYNSASYFIGFDESNEQLYDYLISKGYRVGVHAADDNHNRFEFSESFGGFTYILADKLDYNSIITSLENHEYYASTGPQIHFVGIENGEVTVKCSNARSICIANNTRRRKRFIAPDTNGITECKHILDENCTFFRVVVEDFNGQKAYTRAYFKDEWKN